MTVPREPLCIDCSVVPGNSQFVVVADSTRGLQNTQVAVAAGSAAFVPGSYRKRWARPNIEYTALCTTQNVSLLLEDLTGVAAAATDWETQGAAGTVTVTAATTSTGEFKPLSADWRVRVQAGATGPGTCVVRLVISWADDYGS